VFYQAAIFNRDPVSASIWIGVMLGLLLTVVIGMRLWARREPAPVKLAAEGVAS
jgi:ferrous iron transport protein B